jgi:hypothetical protein
MAPPRNQSAYDQAFSVPGPEEQYISIPAPEQQAQQDMPVLSSRFSNSLANEDFARWLESAQEILIPLYSDLTGKQLQTDADGNMKWVQVGKPKCTEECAEFMILRLRAALNPNVFMSMLEDEDIRQFCIMQSDTFAFTLARKSEDWKLDSYLQDELLEMFRHHIYSGMRRAFKGGEKQMFSYIQRINEMNGMPMNMQGQMGQDQNLSQKFLGMFRR